MAGRYIDYQTTLPTSGGGLSSRRILASIVSIALHLLIIAAVIRFTTQRARDTTPAVSTATERPIQLTFAPPRPVETPRAVQPPPATQPVEPPSVPLTPGRDETPGSTARVVPEPEKNPNAPPDAAREEATRPDPGDADQPTSTDPTPAPPQPTAATANAAAQPTAESEARRIFGRPSALLGPAAGARNNRPWEASRESSNGCTLPPEEADTTLPKGMAMVQGRIFREDNGKPLGGARLQILGTAYGTFSNDMGYYRLLFDRTLVDRCRTQSVRVSAPGYNARDVILFLGERASSDVSLPRY